MPARTNHEHRPIPRGSTEIETYKSICPLIFPRASKTRRRSRLRDLGPRLLIELQHGEVSVSRHGVIACVLALSQEYQSPQISLHARRVRSNGEASEAQLQGDLLVSGQVSCANDPSGGGSNACTGVLKVRVIERIEHFPAE